MTSDFIPSSFIILLYLKVTVQFIYFKPKNVTLLFFFLNISLAKEEEASIGWTLPIMWMREPSQHTPSSLVCI